MTKLELCNLAIKAKAKAYAPYSGFKVGAALLTDNGDVFTGCNIENASYSPTVCAERVAIFKAVSESENKFSMIAVAGGKDESVSSDFLPCGVCRQVMAEFCDSDFIVLVVNENGEYNEYTLDELLPNSFNKSSLK